MVSFKVFGLLAIASTIFCLNIGSLKAQVLIKTGESNALSLSHQTLIEMQQTNAPTVGGGSMQLLRFTNKNVSFTPLEGLDRLFNWQITEDKGFMSNQTLGDRVEQFKLNQRQQIVSDSKILEAMHRINNNKSQ